MSSTVAAGPRRIVVGVSGGIAAYKACHLIRYFTERGDSVQVVPTEAALNFVGAATFEALSGNPVSTTVFSAVDEVRHVRVGKDADLVVIAPATADLMARAAQGRADDLLTATLLTATCPVVFAPAMHTEMWNNPATQDNVATLRRHGHIVLEPAHGRLTGSDTGPGRLPEPEHIGFMADLAYERPDALTRDLEGRKFVISAGGTREALDPVRFLGNHSSGRQGYALADVAVHRGAEVTLVSCAVDRLPDPPGAKVHHVVSAVELAEAMRSYASDADVVVMAAAVADFRPTEISGSKLKKGQSSARLAHLELTENPDILQGLVQQRDGRGGAKPVIVGFAAETGDEDASPVDYAQRKLRKKGCDLLMCNDVSGGATFGAADNAGWLLTGGQQGGDITVTEVQHGSKRAVAAAIIDAVIPLLP
ncbi:bifunctional phosphopantothenoylcysteine decarboxylase/phosphopantothenate--cysteine ligase CoaBC [Corynebacterium sp. TAE3-ERU12]|uniref:bifunctional phosphopantothenoylcysteine decarboxylase/phosphopantothenate--cysteine ligase CoaBC n=1 Tax=Corynebacterium sp. TAE3-ERU12 TaxID=2849491 RepID=UPI001C48598E|nr:bifunctional phosphopantothenoylcysteine decarboxylase/phosphopantothenate--cysteine ligase CoaBC [Corynebacterium sp. TAE3-ERU12]MBV7295393.1 bifunctional phosphopantothenoylcysteine decarboxylase/phosphopantothenate--cysteine ligase CoaBC [Corynebacterium sp. TAE3-ERU12]